MNVAVSSPITEHQAIEAIGEILDARGGGTWADIDAQTDLRELGMDSLELSELFMILEEAAGERLDPASATDVNCVGGLCALRTLAVEHV